MQVVFVLCLPSRTMRFYYKKGLRRKELKYNGIPFSAAIRKMKKSSMNFISQATAFSLCDCTTALAKFECDYFEWWVNSPWNCLKNGHTAVGCGIKPQVVFVCTLPVLKHVDGKLAPPRYASTWVQNRSKHACHGLKNHVPRTSEKIMLGWRTDPSAHQGRTTSYHFTEE